MGNLVHCSRFLGMYAPTNYTKLEQLLVCIVDTDKLCQDLLTQLREPV